MPTSIEVGRMQDEVLKQIARYGYVELTGLACRTLHPSWLTHNGLRVATVQGFNNKGSDEYVIYRPRLERTKHANTNRNNA